MPHHHHGGHHHRGGRGRRSGPVLIIDDTDDEDDDMHRDPHDALMLTDRDTTVVTQATRLLDDMPDPYGASSDEESMFAGVSADDMEIDSRAGINSAKAQSLASRTGTAPTTALPTPMSAPAQPAPSVWPAVGLVAGLVALTYLLGGKKRRA